MAEGWCNLAAFLGYATLVSLSGVMAPGPMTAACLAAAVRRPHAGALMALGHAVIELPLMVLILLGIQQSVQKPSVQIVIGLVGGAFLAVMGVQILADLRRNPAIQARADSRHPLVIGIAMTGGNPYFLLWWASVGLLLVTRAWSLGLLAFALFAAIHWLCDLAWLEALSLATFHGGKLLGGRGQRVFLGLCAAAILFLAGRFLVEAAWKLLHP